VKGKIRWLLTPLVVVALLLCAIPAYASIPTMPHPFYGTVTIGGEAAPVGTEITAKVAGVECGSYTTTVEGQYGSSDPYQDDSLIVQGDIETGAEISFYATNTELGIDEVQADQTYAFSPGASLTELNLTVGEVDNPPTVEINSTATSPTSTSPIPMTATFSEGVTGFEVGDIVVGNGTAGSFAGSGADYTFNVTATGEVVVTVDIAADVAIDAATNGNEAAPTFTINFDDVAPTVVIDSTASDPTGISPIPVTATFSETVTGFVVGDITVGNGAASNFAGSGAVYTFDVTPVIEDAVTVDIAAGVAQDAATNPNEAATQFSITYSTAVPSVTIDSVTSPTNTATQTLTGTMSEGLTVVLTSAEATFGTVTYPTATTWSAVVTLVEGSNGITATADTSIATATIVLDTTVPTGDLGDEIAGIDPGGTLNLLTGTYTGDVTISQSITITGTEGTVISGGIHVAPLTGSNVTIENVTITDYTAYGIRIELVGADDVFIIRNNTIEGVVGSVAGIKVDEVEDGGSLTIERNSISSNEVGIKLLADVADGAIMFNDITDNTFGLEQLAVGSNAYAFCNWWGDISGPEYEAASFEDWPNNPGGLGNAVSDNVDFTPWLTRDFQTVLDDNIAYFGYPIVWLHTGWNIISTPIALDPVVEWEDSDGIARTGVQTWGEYVDLGDGLAIDTEATTYYFGGDTQNYEQVLGTYRLKPCDAIYVKMDEDDVAAILLSPSVSVPSKELYAGWNLVSLAWLPTSMEDMYGLPADEALVTVEEVAGEFTGYKLVVSPGVNAYDPPWIYIAGDSIESWTDPELPQPDGWMWITSGYWVFMLNDGTLAGFTFTPISLWW